MPTRKPRLSRAEEAAHRDYLRQMQAEGIDVEVPEEPSARSFALDIVLGPPGECTVRETRTGGIVYAVLVRLIACSGLTLTDCDITTEWDDQIVLESCQQGPVFGLGGYEYMQSAVLNQRIENTLVLQRGQIGEGLLLATGIRPIPAQYSEFAVAPFRLTFWDQFGGEISAEGALSVLPTSKLGKAGVQRGSGLFGVDETGNPPALSIGEEAGRRYRELLAQNKLAEQRDGGGKSEQEAGKPLHHL